MELLAPALNPQVAREAILHGADAVYIGGPSHGARAAASNSIEDISQVVDFAHIYGVKVYVTLNTIIYDHEIRDVESTIRHLYDVGVDALIVQDMSILRMDIPPIDLHASTQCNIRTPEKARFLADCGFSQLVLPREFSLQQIKEIRQAVPQDVVLEAFVHGALCVSYSGDCQASQVAKGRSANRGECAQMCRLPYDLTDAYGRVLVHDKHLLSLRDLNRLPDLQALADAGIGSFKIEGRLKDASYAKHVVGAYSRAMDKIVASAPDRYSRTSYGYSTLTFTPDVEKAFNRGFTSYFLTGRPLQPVKMANIDTPKWVGTRVGTANKTIGNTIEAKLNTTLHNGDGLGYFDADGQYKGFRLNKVEGSRLFPATPVEIKPGTPLYRNRDIQHDTQMQRDTATRLIPITMLLTRSKPDEISLTISTKQGESVTAHETTDIDAARTPQTQARETALSKLGGTPFVLQSLEDRIDERDFVRASVLNALRQRAVGMLTEMLKERPRNERRQEMTDATYPYSSLSYHDNVANEMARQFYIDHGVSEIEPAIETRKAQPDHGTCVMTTRYCLRRELGACLKEEGSKRLPSPLYISNNTARYRLEFDCNRCEMHLLTAKKQ